MVEKIFKEWGQDVQGRENWISIEKKGVMWRRERMKVKEWERNVQEK